MSDAFISFADQDEQVVLELCERLGTRGIDASFEREYIPPDSVRINRIMDTIETAHNFILIVSPDCLIAEHCHLELNHAFICQKRIVPILIRDIEFEGRLQPSIVAGWLNKEWEVTARDNWKFLKELQWVYCLEAADFPNAIHDLIDILNADKHYIKSHTDLLLKARVWERRNRDSLLLLDGAELHDAEFWMAGGNGMTPQPSQLHRMFITASRVHDDLRDQESRQHERRTVTRLRLLAGFLLLLVIGVIAVAAVSYLEFQDLQDDLATATFAQGEMMGVAATAQSESDTMATQVEMAEDNALLAQNEAIERATQIKIAEDNAAIANLRLTQALLDADMTQTAIVEQLTQPTATIESPTPIDTATHTQTQTLSPTNTSTVTQQPPDTMTVRPSNTSLPAATTPPSETSRPSSTPAVTASPTMSFEFVTNTPRP